MRMLAIVLMAVWMVGCSKGSSGSSASCGSKALRSTWVSQSLSMDLTGIVFQTPFTMVVTSGGGSCQFDVTLFGSECSGNYTIANDTCGLETAGTYTKSAAGLTMCSTAPSVNCNSYQ